MLTWMLSVAWILGSAGSAIVLALVLHFLVPAKGVKVPAVVIGTIGGLVVGICIGIGGRSFTETRCRKQFTRTTTAPSPFPGAGSPKGSNAGGVPPPANAKKKAAGDSVGKGPGKPGRCPATTPAPTNPGNRARRKRTRTPPSPRARTRWRNDPNATARPGEVTPHRFNLR